MTRNETATDYSASAFPFPSFFKKRHDLEFFGNEGVVLKIFHTVIPYTTDAQANAATRNPQLKLIFRLVHFYLQDEGRQPFVFFACMVHNLSPRKPRCILVIRSLARVCEHVFFSDADELEWYIPAGIEVSDLQRSLTVIEQFEKSPLDLAGKRASQLLHKKRRRRRRRRQASSSDSEGAGSSDEDAPRKKARKTRERETYKSAQFIEDSEEEYGRDIDAFFTREAELRKRTALTAASAAAAAAADGHQPQRLGTMRATGTKKRRRAQPSRGTSTAKGRAAKRRALLSSSGTPGKNGEGEDGGINAVTPHRSPSPTASFDDDHDANGAADDDDDGGGVVGGGIDGSGDSGGSGDEDDDEGDAQQSSIVDRDVAGHRHPDSPQSPKSHRPKARPLYRRHAPLRATPAADATPDTSAAGTDDEDDDHDDGAGHDPSPTVPSLRAADEDESTRQAKGGGSGGGGGGGGGGVSGGLRKGRLIISDEED